MRILIVGRGAVGCIYGWALSQAGADVTHVVRKQGLASTCALDLLDLRPGYPKHTRIAYASKIVTAIDPSDGFDLVIVATKHYQAADAIRQYLPATTGALYLLFTANWEGTEEIDRLLPRSSLIWAYASATGGFDGTGTLIATLNPSVRIGMLEGSDPARYKLVADLFQSAGFTLDVKPNIVQWVWVHHAINGGMIGTLLAAGGLSAALRFNRLCSGVWAAREALAVVQDRGVDLARYPDAGKVIRTPPWVAALFILYASRFTEAGRRLLRASHFDDSPDEMKRFYCDVLSTGESRGLPMPRLSALREAVAHYPILNR